METSILSNESIEILRGWYWISNLDTVILFEIVTWWIRLT